MENEIKLLREYLDVHPDTELKETLEARIQELETRQYHIVENLEDHEGYKGQPVKVSESHPEDYYTVTDGTTKWHVGIEEIEPYEDIPNSAEFVKEVTVIDPDSKAPVEMAVFKHNETGGMFAIDSSYLDQCFDDDTDPCIPDPFNDGQTVTLYNL
jgi:hypothetical protein